MVNIWYAIGRNFSGIVLKLFYRVQVSFRGNIPEEGPLIICSNHLSELDMFLIGTNTKRYVRFMAKTELFKIPIIGKIIKLWGAFPVDRKKADIGAIKTALKIIKQEGTIGIFPEGTRSRKTKTGVARRARAKPGAAMIAIRTGAPILPVLIEGNVLPFSKIKVTFGEPYKIEQTGECTMEELSQHSEEIMEKVYSLRGD